MITAMIDWVKALVPLGHDNVLHGGQIISLDRSGNVEWNTSKRLKLRGSYESTLHIQSDHRTFNPATRRFTHLLIDGNPVKFFQGHNIFGTNDLIGLVAETVVKISEILQIPIPPSDMKLILAGNYELKRIDCTMMVELGRLADVRSALYAFERLAFMRYKGKGIMSDGTLYFGKHSRRQSLKMYAKGDEIRAKGHELPNELTVLPELYKWADSKLRLEAVTRAMELKDRGLHLACNWNENTPEEILLAALSGIDMSENCTITETALAGLPPRLVAVYHLWREGHDIRQMYPSTTFKRYRKQLQEAAGIDIAIKQGNRQEPAPNVVEFRRILRPERCTQVPDWAIGTPLFFEPRVKISA